MKNPESLIRCLMLALLLGTPVGAHAADAAQAPPAPKAEKIDLKAGDSCEIDKRTKGIVKQDACGRWWCGYPDRKDISEVWPTFDQDLHCTWRLEGEKCKCRRTPAAAPPKKKK